MLILSTDICYVHYPVLAKVCSLLLGAKLLIYSDKRTCNLCFMQTA
jgi:hypothetical protein